MIITSAQYQKNKDDDQNIAVSAVVDGITMSVPLDPNNRHYAAILAWAEEDSNEIAAAD